MIVDTTEPQRFYSIASASRILGLTETALGRQS